MSTLANKKFKRLLTIESLSINQICMNDFLQTRLNVSPGRFDFCLDSRICFKDFLNILHSNIFCKIVKSHFDFNVNPLFLNYDILKNNAYDKSKEQFANNSNT